MSACSETNSTFILYFYYIHSVKINFEKRIDVNHLDSHNYSVNLTLFLISQCSRNTLDRSIVQETHTVPSHTPRASDQSNVPMLDCERNQKSLKPSCCTGDIKSRKIWCRSTPLKRQWRGSKSFISLLETQLCWWNNWKTGYNGLKTQYGHHKKLLLTWLRARTAHFPPEHLLLEISSKYLK